MRTPHGGYLDAGGRPRPHLWLEGRRAGCVYVVDITAGQFGGPGIIASVRGSDRHRANATRPLLARYRWSEAAFVELYLEALWFFTTHRAATPSFRKGLLLHVVARDLAVARSWSASFTAPRQAQGSHEVSERNDGQNAGDQPQ